MYSSPFKFGSHIYSKIEEVKSTGCLNIDEKIIDESLCHEISEFFSKNDIVKSLDCSGKQLSGNCLSIFGKIIMLSKNLNKIKFSNNQIGDSHIGFQSFCEGIMKNYSIDEIDLSNNNLGPNSANIVAEYCIKNSRLKKINLSYNRFGSDGCKFILNAIRSNNSVILLNLNGNMCDQYITNEIDKIIDQNKLYQSKYQKPYSSKLNPDFEIKSLKNIQSIDHKNEFRNKVSYPPLIPQSHNFSSNLDEDNLKMIDMNKNEDKIFDLYMSQKNYFEIERSKIEGILIEQKRETENERNKSKALENEIQNLKNELQEMEKENFDLKKELVNQEDSKKSHDINLKELDNRILDLKNSNEILNNQISGLKGMLNSSEELNKKIKFEYEEKNKQIK